MYDDEPYLLKAMESGLRLCLEKSCYHGLGSALFALSCKGAQAIHPSLIKILVESAPPEAVPVMKATTIKRRGPY